MFAQFGNIIFELLPSVGGYSEKGAYRYAEHEVISGKPKSQSIGESLLEISLQLRFDTAFCDPEAEIYNLKRLQRSGSAQDFVLGSGVYKGQFVITDLSTTVTRMSNGSMLSAELELSLKEFSPSSAVAVTNKTRSVAKKKKAQDDDPNQSLPARNELYVRTVDE